MEVLNVIVITLVVMLSSRDGITADTNDVKLANAVNDFSLKLYKELSKTQDNLFCSGFSFSVALNMLLVGARGNTATEIRSVLGYESSGLTQSDIEESFKNLLTEQRSNHSGYEFDIANSMWIQSGHPVLSDFKSTLQNKFYAQESEVTFGTPEATDAINSWVNDATKGKIPKLFDERLDSLTRLVLVNAMFFKGTWVTKFHKDNTEDFAFNYRENNATLQKDVKMMNIVKSFPYTESNVLNSQVVELPYQGNEVSMVIVLPFPDQDLNGLEKKLTMENLNTSLGALENVKVRLRMPKFESSSNLKLNAVLKALGINDAFDHSKADLSGIDGTLNLFVSKTVQKAVVEVSEEGTKAAAASGVAASIRTVYKPKIFAFTADRPFIYLIRHKPSGILYFMGKFAKP